MTDLDQIQAFFERHCARLPDPVGMRVYAEHLAAGTSLQTLEAAIASSEEARRVAIWRRITGKQAPETENERVMLTSIVLSAVVADPAPPPPPPPPPAPVELAEAELFVSSVYLAILGRRPDATGLAAYAESIAHGLPLLQVVKDVMNSDEARQLNGPRATLAREQQLRGWAKLPPLKRLCTGMANALVAQEYLRLWNKRMPRGHQATAEASTA